MYRFEGKEMNAVILLLGRSGACIYIYIYNSKVALCVMRMRLSLHPIKQKMTNIDI